ncbi:hypothetical protein P4B35_16255 [Pontiellaceae bacterium B12227]|nr:hypothetical protein [Pontiellaceae bacterium B12227]
MNRPQPRKEGAALVIALGFLALLTVMIVAFMLQSRSERLAGRAYLNNAQAKQMLHTALARAMEDIDTTFGSNYPAYTALGSTGNSGLSIAGSIDFSTELDFLPLGKPDISNEFTAAVNAADWENILVDGTNVGRMAYVIVNTSGLLDANAIGARDGAATLVGRGSGISPAEIQLTPDILPELNESALLVDADGALSSTDNPNLAFVYNRDTAWQRFETLRDLKVLNGTDYGSVLSGGISSFNVFSHYPETTDLQGLELTETLDEIQFSRVLMENCGFNADEAQNIVDNYFDYIDPDSIPRDLTGSSPEAVPMLNEIWIENFEFTHDLIDRTNVSYEIKGEMYIETWYPFDEPYDSGGYLEVIAADPGTTNNMEIVGGEEYILQSGYMTVVVAYTNLSKALIIPLTEISAEPSADGHFVQYSYGFDFQDSFELNISLEADDDVEPTDISLRHEEIEIIISEPVDRVENTDIKITLIEDAIADGVVFGCYDPRVNHDFGLHWETLDNSTPNALNELDDWGEEEELGNKENIRFYVSNQPMTNAAELGHLSTGDPWDTVRLYAGGDDPDPVLDYFYTETETTNTQSRSGLININSPHADVLATAFYKAPILEGTEVTAEQALVLGETLAPLATAADNNRSHAGKALSGQLPDWNQLTDAQKDSIVGNTYRLFGYRDTSYTILLVTQEGTDLNGNGIEDEEVRSTQQAVVQVWRDPDSQKAGIVFFGLTDTLRSSIGSGNSWADILTDFAP